MCTEPSTFNIDPQSLRTNPIKTYNVYTSTAVTPLIRPGFVSQGWPHKGGGGHCISNSKSIDFSILNINRYWYMDTFLTEIDLRFFTISKYPVGYMLRKLAAVLCEKVCISLI